MDPDSLLGSLSLSGNPVVPTTTKSNPVFGLPSLTSSIPRTGYNDLANDGDTEMVDDDAMDWTPTSPQRPERSATALASNPTPSQTFLERVRAGQHGGDDGTWLRPQRFFPPEQPTGLEMLLAKTGLTDVVGPTNTDGVGVTRRDVGLWDSSVRQGLAQAWPFRWVCVGCLVPLIGVVWHAWTNMH
jgi:hypothetical protein